MWKKQNEASGIPLDPSQEDSADPMPDSVADVLMGIIRDNHPEKTAPIASVSHPAPAPISEMPAAQPSSAGTLAYTEAVNRFTKKANEFMAHLPLLAEAREAYEQALKASLDMRKVLDSGDENLRNLKTQLEQMLNTHLIKPIAEKKKLEPSRVEAIRAAAGDSRGGLQKLP